MSALRSAPWTRAPLLLLRRPVVFLAVALATAVLSIAAASGVLYLSTIGTASLRVQSAADCPELSMPSFVASVPNGSLARADGEGLSALRAATGQQPYSVALASARVQSTRVTLFARAGALDHVQTLTPVTGGPGAWVPDVFATKLGVHPGDEIATLAGKQIRVAGIYRTLAPDPYSLSELPRYWCTWHDLIVPRVGESPAGPWLIADQGTVDSASDNGADLAFYDPLPAATPLAQASLGPAHASSAAVRFEQRTNLVTVASKDLAAKVDAARRVQNGMGGSIVPIDLAGVLVAGLLVAGAGAFWATSRAREIRLLVARGVGPGALAAKAVLETLPAALLGLLGGFFGAVALVRATGPTSVLAPGAPLRALGVAALAVLVALAIIAMIGASAGREKVAGARRSWAGAVPWELALLAAGAWAGLRIRSRSAVSLVHGVIRVDPLTFVFPLLAATAALLLLARLIGLVLPRIGRASPSSNAAYLAVRRLAGSRAVVLGLIVGTALPCGLLTYASTITHGISTDVTAKYRTNLGAQHVLEVTGSLLDAPRLDGHGTPVAVVQSEPTLPDGTHVRILGVDPATFARFAYLNSTQRTAVGKIPYAGGVDIAAILVNAPTGINATSVTVLSTQLTLDVVSDLSAFPGLRDSFAPMLVIDRSALTQIDPNADRDNQVWTTDAEYGPTVRAIVADHFSVLTELTSQVLIGNTGLLPVTWIFSYLRGLAALIGVVALAGLVFALSARSRRRTVSYVLSRRMGMSQATHIRSLIIELSIAVGTGWLAGVAVGSAADAMVYRSLDVFPDLPPPPTFSLALPVLAGTALIVAMVVVVASLTTHLFSERARPAEILRLE